VRDRAAEALGAIGDSRAIESLVKALVDEDWWVRRGAAEAIDRIGDVKTADPLIHALARGFGGCAIRLPKQGGL
jgi:HEAT repeat protein